MMLITPVQGLKKNSQDLCACLLARSLARRARRAPEMKTELFLSAYCQLRETGKTDLEDFDVAFHFQIRNIVTKL